MSNTMDDSSMKYSSSSLPKQYQYPHWELPAMNVVLSHSLLGLSGYKKLLQEKQSIIPRLVGLSREEANYVLLDEKFYQLLVDEHFRICEYYSAENMEKEEKIQDELLAKAEELNDDETINKLEYENMIRQARHFEIEQDKSKWNQRNSEINNGIQNLFPNLYQLNHGDIIQFRNERLQFSFYVYKAKRGTFEQLLNQFKQYVKNMIGENGSISNVQKLSVDDHRKFECILIPSIGCDGYGISPLFSDAPLFYFKHLSSGLMYRWIYLDLIDESMPIYDLIQKDIQLKKQSPTYRTLVNEAGDFSDTLINESEDGEEMIIEDLNSFPNAYVFIYDEVKTKLNIEWRKIDSNDYCNQYSSIYLLAKWTQQLQHENI